MLFHYAHQMNIEQTFHVLLKRPQQVCVRRMRHCSHMRLCIKQCDSRFLPSLGATLNASTAKRVL